MLRNFEHNIYGLTPSEKKPDNNKKRNSGLEKLKEIDSYDFNSLEKKAWEIWKDESIDKTKKYKQIFKIFFSEFCNKLGNKFEIDSEVGQWIQGTLERFGCMDIPISALLYETATEVTPQEFQKKREVFNKELSSRLKGAISTVSYVNGRVKDKPEIRIVVNDELDLQYKTDMIEIIGYTADSISEVCITQVKTDSRMTPEEKVLIHKKHIALLKEFEDEEQNFSQNLEQEKMEMIKLASTVNSIIEEIQLFILDLENVSNPKSILKKIISKFEIDEILFLKILAEMEFEEDDILEPEKFVPLIELAKETTSVISEERSNSFFPSKCKKIISKITNGNQVISEIVLKS